MGFPKCDGCCTVTAAELNYMFDPYDIKASMLENSVNVTKLNYKYSLQEITHDYMVVDVFTDSTGYNNTIPVSCNSPYTVTGELFFQSCCCYNGAYSPNCATFCQCVGNYNVYNCVYFCNAYARSCIIGCVCTSDLNLVGVSYFCFMGICCAYASNSNDTRTLCWTISGFSDESNYCIRCTSGTINVNCTNCYCYARGVGDYFFVYKNGVNIDYVSICAFPNIKVCSFICGETVNGPDCAMVNVTYQNFCYGCSNTTSVYNSSGLTGYYGNFFCCASVVYPKQLTICCSNPDGGMNLSCYGTLQSLNFSGCTAFTCGTVCICCFEYLGKDLTSSISNVESICFNTWLCACISTNCATDCGVVCGGINFTDYSLAFTCTLTGNSGTMACCINVNHCYTKLCTNCFRYYCNGVCKCDVTFACFPQVCYSSYVYAKNTFSAMRLCLDSVCIISDLVSSKVSTVPICWSAPIKTIYYTDEKYGTGTVVYNVIDASIGCCIACGLLPNTIYLLCDSVCCHIYEIIQCNDAISCIKSYAILAGHA